MGGLSIWHWLIVLLVVILVFGTKKLKNLGGDLGSAVKGFKDGMRDGQADEAAAAAPATQVTQNKSAASGETIDVQAKEKS